MYPAHIDFDHHLNYLGCYWPEIAMSKSINTRDLYKLKIWFFEVLGYFEAFWLSSSKNLSSNPSPSLMS